MLSFLFLNQSLLVQGMAWRLEHLNEFRSSTKGSFQMVEWDWYEADDH